MAQLPASMRRKTRPAISSIHEKPPSPKQKMVNAGGWILLSIALAVLAVGLYSLYKVMTDATVAQLQVVGTNSDIENQQLQQHLSPIIQDNYFTSDLERIRDQALTVSWVDRVVVSRAWPNAIRVRVMPRHAIARWGTGRLLSDNGDVFSEAIVKTHPNLPLLHGPVSQSKMMMRRYNEINQLYLTERMTWFMQFDSGLRIIVDQDQTMNKLQRLSQLAQNDLKPVWSNISAIDLRYRNGLSIQWKNAIPPKIVNGQLVVTINDTSLAGAIQAKP
ncbi:MAG: FtsQ-type POTRA domain-containing protein [Acinetobacter sp.]